MNWMCGGEDAGGKVRWGKEEGRMHWSGLGVFRNASGVI